jgi:hypothetical protein
MNLIIIPFHDWRKSESEGFRTRDVHFIKSLSKNRKTEKILVVNRPTTWLELLYKKQRKKLDGKVIYRKEEFTLTQVNENTFITDYCSWDVINQFRKRHLWFVEKYTDLGYVNFINDCCKRLQLDECCLITQNVFSYKLAIKLEADRKLFDAWDNFLKFPAYKKIQKKIEIGYNTLSKNINIWVTNSQENITFFKSKFNPSYISLVKNGVKTNFISEVVEPPEDLKKIRRPIVGFGGKISYLINYELINYLSLNNPEVSFVFVGQILDKRVYNNIIKRKNIFFLGDKHYSIYPNYVQNFDACIIPYNINEGQHGGDSIKAYEYLLTNKKVIGTKGNGLLGLKDHLYLVNTPEEFSKELKNLENKKPRINIKDHSWESKAIFLLKILRE